MMIFLVLGLSVTCGGESSGLSTEVSRSASSTTVATGGETRLQMPLASTDLGVGSNRLAFGLIDIESGPLRSVPVMVSTFYLGSGGSGAEDGPEESLEAVFRKWPVGASGVYTVQLFFSKPGIWGIGAVATLEDGSTASASVAIQVNEKSATPGIGTSAPRSAIRTSGDVPTLAELTTDPEPEPSLYLMTIAEALDTGEPLVLIFSSPAYCQTATCGPQLDVVKDLKRQYDDRANFIHVEIYDNPHLIQGDLSQATLVQAVDDWGISAVPGWFNESWTFVLNPEGVITQSFEGYATLEELEEALTAMLD